MLKTTLLLLISIYLIPTSLKANDTIAATNPLIEYTGRIDFSDPYAPTFSFSGISVRACFTGTSIQAVLNDEQGQNYYNVLIDGAVYDTLHVTAGTKSYRLAENLSDTIHEIELFKRTELTFGKGQFLGFILDKGKSLQPIDTKRPYFIEYIGNSITCGYGNEGKLGELFSPETENHYLSYAAITSRNLNARHMAVSRSGIGVYRNYDGPTTGSQDCMANLYTHIFLYENKPIYDFQVQPDVICINLGTNDFSTTGADSARYIENYLRLIDTLQTKYSNPNIICLLGPMLSGNSLEKIRGCLKYIAEKANKEGKGKVVFFEMSAQTGELGIGIDYHPTVAQHEKNAGELTTFIMEFMNWEKASSPL